MVAAQHRTMIEAVENHMPEVVIVDEIGTEAEALAARSIAQRGVQLVATAHGGELARLIKNPTLSDLIGGIQTCAHFLLCRVVTCRAYAVRLGGGLYRREHRPGWGTLQGLLLASRDCSWRRKGEQ